jgi:hypothetical protein
MVILCMMTREKMQRHEKICFCTVPLLCTVHIGIIPVNDAYSTWRTP